METTEKAAIRIEHCIEPNEDHAGEYEALARELEAAGHTESARHIHETVKLTAGCSESLRRALNALQ